MRQATTGISLAGPIDALSWAVSTSGSPELLAAGMGGVWRFDPAAQTWLATALAVPVASLLVAPGGTVYAGTGVAYAGHDGPAGAGIMFSTDGGATWTVAGASQFAGLSITRLLLDPADPAHLLAAAVSAPDTPASARPGVYASQDAGASWTLLLPGEFFDLAWQGSTVIAAGATAIELSSSAAAPQSFAPLTGLPSAWVRAALAPAGASGFLLLLAEPAAGASLWSISASGVVAALASLPQLNGAASLALAINGAGQILAAGDGLWFSSGFGQSWQPIATAAAGQNAVLADAGNNFWVAGNHGVWRLPAGAAALSSLNTGLANAAPLALLLGAESNLAILGGGGIASGPASTNAVWTVSSASVPLTALAPDPAQPGALYGIAQGQLLHSADGGASWQPSPLPNGFSATPTSLASSSQGLWIGASNGLLIAPNGAQASFSAPVDQIALDAGAIWVASGANLYASTDDGQTWDLLLTATSSITALAVDALQPQIVAAACSVGVFWSANGGSSWSSPQSLPVSVPVMALEFDSQQTLWAATLGRGLWSASFSNQGAALSVLNPPASEAAGATISLQAQLLQSGSPVAGASLFFSASENAASVWSGAASTDAEGIAAITFSVSRAGLVTIQVTPPPTVAAAPLQISFPVVAGPPALLQVLSGAGQAQLVATTLAAPVLIQVNDAFGNPVPGASVALTGSSSTAASAITRSNGQVAFTLQLPPLPGPASYTASVAGAPALTWQEDAFTFSDFQLSLTPPASATPPGQPQTLLLRVVPGNGFNQPVSLRCVQPLVNCQISPATVVPGETAAITVNALINQPALTVQITGVDAVAAGSTSVPPQSASLALPLQAFSLSAPVTAMAAQAGSTTSPVDLKLTAFNGLTGPLQFQLTLADGAALPAGLIPAFQPASAALAAQPVQVQLVLSTPAPQTARIVPRFRPQAPVEFLLGLILFLLAFALRYRRTRPALGIACLCLAAAACGGAPSSTPPPSTSSSPPVVYNLQLTASSQGLSASIPFQLTLTP